MNEAMRMQNRTKTLAILLALGVLGGCAAPKSAPVRDGNGVSAAPVSRPVDRSTTHVVNPGETLLGIARQYGRSLADLISWNGLANPDQISVGQYLRIAPPDVGTGSAVAVAVPVPAVPATVTPMTTPTGPVEPAAVPIQQTPQGGTQPYSDQAWAKLDPSAGAAITPTPPPTAAPATATDGKWSWPASGRVIAGFNESSNKGVDIGGKPGDPVFAAAPGKVVYSGSGLRGYGKLVVIKHDQEYNSVYAHNQNLLVKENDVVTKGQKIAELGSTDADRPKLHFEIRRQGRAVDPMQYLPAR